MLFDKIEKLEEGVSKFDASDFQGAAKDFSFILMHTKLSPDIPEYTGIIALSHNNLGMAHLKQGNFQAAIPVFNKAIELAPEQGSYLFNRAYLNLKLNNRQAAEADYMAAIKSIEKIVDRYYGNLEPVALKIDLSEKAQLQKLFDKNKNENALVENDNVASTVGNIALATPRLKLSEINKWSKSASIKMMNKNFQGALDDFAQVIQLTPETDENKNELANVYNHCCEANRELKRYDDAIKAINKAIQFRGGAQDYNNLGHIKVELELFEEALFYFEKTILMDPSISTAYANRAFVKVKLARQIESAKQAESAVMFHDAIADYTKAIQLAPNDRIGTNYISRGNLYLQLGEFEKAIRDYDQVIKLSVLRVPPGHYFNRGLAKYSLAKERNNDTHLLSEAISDFELVLSLAPTHKAALVKIEEAKFFLSRPFTRWVESAGAKIAENDFQGAIDDFTQAIQLLPDIDENKNELSYLYNKRGLVYSELQDIEAAIQDYTKAIFYNPLEVNFFVNRGRKYLVLGEYQKAEIDYEKLAQLRNGSSDHNNLGFVRIKLGHMDGAIACFDQAIELDTLNASAYFNRAFTNGELAYQDRVDAEDRARKAINDYTAAIELKPDNIALCYFRRANLFYLLKEYSQTISELDYLIELKPASLVDCYYLRGLAKCDLAGKENNQVSLLASALKDFDNAILLKPDYKKVSVKRDEVKKIIGQLEASSKASNQNIPANTKPTKVSVVAPDSPLKKNSEKTPEERLRLAASENNFVLLKELLGQDINVDAQGPGTKRTALHWAVIKGSIECVELLLAAKARTDIPDASTEEYKSGRTAKDYAKKSDNEQIQQLMNVATAANNNDATNNISDALKKAVIS